MSDASSTFSALKSKFSRFTDSVRMTDINREISNIGATVAKLPDEIQKVRSRGYAFSSWLENKADVFQDHWNDIRHRVQRAIDDETDELKKDYDETEQRLVKVEKLKDSPQLEKILPEVETFVERLEDKIEAAQRRIRDIYATLSQDVNQTTHHLTKLNWYCDQKDEASFEFLAGEALFLVAEAEWVDGNDNPDGILYLTDQRLIFEQKEKTGKTLGLFGGKKVQEVEWAIPLHQIEGVEPENKGMLGGIDLLHFSLGSGAPYVKITVEVKGGVDCKFWAKQVQRMIRGETDDERAIEPDPEIVEKLRSAPSVCHVCGGTLPMLVAGQNQIECPYCGGVIRI